VLNRTDLGRPLSAVNVRWRERECQRCPVTSGILQRNRAWFNGVVLGHGRPRLEFVHTSGTRSLTKVSLNRHTPVANGTSTSLRQLRIIIASEGLTSPPTPHLTTVQPSEGRQRSRIGPDTSQHNSINVIGPPAPPHFQAATADKSGKDLPPQNRGMTPFASIRGGHALPDSHRFSYPRAPVVLRKAGARRVSQKTVQPTLRPTMQPTSKER
jgi:hypothetical protein